MFDIQLMNKTGQFGSPFKLPFVPRPGDYLNVDGTRWLVAEVNIVIVGGVLQGVQVAVY